VCTHGEDKRHSQAETLVHQKTWGVVVFVPKPEFRNLPWDLLLNSSVIRFAHLLILRVGLIDRGKFHTACHINPRTVAAFPIPNKIGELNDELLPVVRKLRKLGTAIGERWETIAIEIAKSQKTSLALQKVDFSNWQSDIEEEVELRLQHEGGSWLLKPYVDNQPTFLELKGNYDLLNVTKFLLEDREKKQLSASELQSFKIPVDFAKISRHIDEARDHIQTVDGRMSRLANIDKEFPEL